MTVAEWAREFGAGALVGVSLAAALPELVDVLAVAAFLLLLFGLVESRSERRL